jgi:hypothetical protein
LSKITGGRSPNKFFSVLSTLTLHHYSTNIKNFLKKLTITTYTDLIPRKQAIAISTNPNPRFPEEIGVLHRLKVLGKFTYPYADINSTRENRD